MHYFFSRSLRIQKFIRLQLDESVQTNLLINWGVQTRKLLSALIVLH